MRGTTSACAENTHHLVCFGCTQRNYLRVRGEYNCPPCNPCSIAELPPRARRIPRGHDLFFACNRNYLRVRGEYLGNNEPGLWPRELPPRARRILRHPTSIAALHGTTSACAENTCGNAYRKRDGWNYLRVRGEYPDWVPTPTSTGELPPRARRIPHHTR